MAEIIGTDGNNRLSGTAVGDKIYGLGSDDDILGVVGNDIICGDGRAPPIVSQGIHLAARPLIGPIGMPEPFGNDALDGGAGEDQLYGGGRDELFGRNGNDTLYGANGNDRLEGGSSNDRLYGQKGDDLILGGDGDDNIADAVGNNLISAGAGNDYVLGSGSVEGDDGDDDLYGHGATVLRGGEGHDRVHCGAGAQTVAYGSVSEDDASAVAPIFTNEIVFDFNRTHGDRFDVSQIDANENLGGNQTFAFVGNAPVDRAGEIGILVTGGVTYVVAETNGLAGTDLMVEMSNSVIGISGDFIL